MELRLPRTVPEWSGLAAAAAAAAAFSYDPLLRWTGWSPRCAVRAHVGIPCPFCGGTTAIRAIGDGRLLEAVAASPLVTAMAAFSAVMLVVFVLRLVRAAPPPEISTLRTQRALAAAALAIACLSTLYQLVRLGTGPPV